MEMRNINNKVNFKNGILEIEMDTNGQFNEETTKFILEKVKEAKDENIWYTHKEVIEELDKLEEKNNQCTRLFILKEQK